MMCKKCALKIVAAGQAMTRFKCEQCNEELTWHNTYCPKFCTKCAIKLNACMRCGTSGSQQDLNTKYVWLGKELVSVK